MPCISGSFNPQVGPILRVAVVEMDFASVAEESPALHTDDALIDTGATNTCISQKVVTEVGLDPVGKTLMTGATGVSPVDQFAFRIGFIQQTTQEPTGNVSGNLLVKPIMGCLFENGAATFDVLLGRDVICDGAFHLSFDGHYTLSI